ncbi:MAG: DEAD/DEAH box helicase [Pseudomonadota bacterium]
MTATEPPSFADLGLDPVLLRAVEELGFDVPTPIQAAVIQHLLAGRDVIGRARTGSGKTAAFGLPLLQALQPHKEGPQALVVCPTRERAIQVAGALETFAAQAPVAFATIYGGAPYPPQIRALERAAVVVGTPGRLLDHLQRGTLELGEVHTFVLDEADEMLRMGFLEDVTRLLDATPTDRQVALFSATMPEPIRQVALRLSDPVEVQVEDRELSVGHIEQHWVEVPAQHKLDALVRVLKATGAGTTLVFTRTRAACAETADALAKRGLAVDALHGDLAQAARERVLERMRARQLSIVIATDVASRGIDVDHITHIVNFDLPPEVESYVHRIGRTSRAARRGTAISLCTPRDKERLKWFQRATGSEIMRMEVPSDADIVRATRRRLVDELRDAMDSSTDAGAAMDELMAIHGWTERQLGAAALTLLTRRDGVALGELPDEEPPSWAQPQQKYGQDFDRTNEVEIFLPIGRSHGLTPADVVGALTNEGGMTGRQIGRITITPKKTFVGMSRATGEALLARTQQLQLRNRTVFFHPARPQGAPPPRPPPGPPRPAPPMPRDQRGPPPRRPYRDKHR